MTSALCHRPAADGRFAAFAQRLRRPMAESEGRRFRHQGFPFKSGEALPALISTTPRWARRSDTLRRHRNAVILLHGTSSSGKAWLMPSLADELFRP